MEGSVRGEGGRRGASRSHALTPAPPHPDTPSSPPAADEKTSQTRRRRRWIRLKGPYIDPVAALAARARPDRNARRGRPRLGGGVNGGRRADVSVIVDASGNAHERVKYSPCLPGGGVPRASPPPTTTPAARWTATTTSTTWRTTARPTRTPTSTLMATSTRFCWRSMFDDGPRWVGQNWSRCFRLRTRRAPRRSLAAFGSTDYEHRGRSATCHLHDLRQRSRCGYQPACRTRSVLRVYFFTIAVNWTIAGMPQW